MKTGDDYFDSKEFQELLETYEKAVNAGQPVFMDAEELAEIADYYQMQGHLEEAEKTIQLALSLAPGAIAPLTYRIHEALYNGDTKAAWDYLGQIIETDEPDYIYDRGEIMIVEGRIDEADSYFRDELKNVPQEEYQDYVIDVASIYSDYNFSDKAMEWMTLAKQEESPDFKELMARTLFGLGKYKASEKLFNELIDTDPFQKRYWNALASAQFMNEDYSSAIESSEYAIAIDPEDPDGIIAKAHGLFRLNNYEKAIEYYDRYLERVPDDIYVMLNKSSCYLSLSNDEKALETLLHALETAGEDSPYLTDIYQELAFVYSDRGETDMALDYLNKTDVLDCDHVQIKVIKGHVLLAGDRLEEAQKMFRKAVLESNGSTPILLRIIVSLYDNKYIEGAYHMLQKFFSIVDEKNNEGYAYMALCCHDLKRDEEFMRYLKIACEKNTAECRMVLAHLFPEDVKPEDYYNYLKTEMKK